MATLQETAQRREAALQELAKTRLQSGSATPIMDARMKERETIQAKREAAELARPSYTSAPQPQTGQK